MTPAAAWRLRLAERYPWLPFVLPLAVYMGINALEPTPGGDPSGSWLPIAYCWYPLVYAVKLVATAAALWLAWPTYRQFPLRVSGWGLGAGLVGAAVWIGLCELPVQGRWKIDWRPSRVLGIETNLHVDVDFAAHAGAEPAGAPPAAGARSAYNPFDQLASRPAMAWLFLLVRFLGLAAIVPVIEEFFLRGFFVRFFVDVQWWRSPPERMNAAAWIAGLAYPLLSHPWHEWLAAVPWFLLVTLVLLKTKNLWDCVLAHAVTNFLLGVYVVTTGRWWLM